jgi:membrane-bound lytic murein transglycosylase D
MRLAIPSRSLLARVVAPLSFVAAGTAFTSGLDHTSLRTLNELNGPVRSATVAPALPAAAVETVASAQGDQRPSLNVEGVDNKHIDRWVDRLTTTAKRDFANSLARMSKYAGMITKKLDERQMPKDLVYLAMIESNFDPNAKSPAKAVGLWQFMSATARQFGLTVGGKVDERKNPAKATDAALSYLSKLHDRFGSWYLAAAAYNSGEGTVSRALKKETGRTKGTDADFFRILPRLPRETQQYVPKLIASARVGNSITRQGAALD